ncbi:MAG: hypothetical protein IKW28_07815 [Lachnospiraceae bacterium]|nr:hypothetical protein [Lachnospiraceae bacterium]
MKEGFLEKKMVWMGALFFILMLQVLTAVYFCNKKSGFHYDEYYSYYSTNKTYGLVPGDRAWKDTKEILSEFMVREGEGWRFGLVKEMQGFDVHPPFYYYVLHGVCSLFPGSFSKWSGLGINLVLFIISYFLLAAIGSRVFSDNKRMTLLLCLLYGFQPGVLSGITFIRMYMLLTVWCMAVTLWHAEFWKRGLRLTKGKAAVLFLLVFLGFLTHYYFLVFLFFLCAFTCLAEWWGRKNLKGSILYGVVVCAAIMAGIAYYPASLRHILRGYRGTEAAGAFFDLKNTGMRLGFFADLMNDSVFGGSLELLLILLILLAITFFYWKKKYGGEQRKGLADLAVPHVLWVTMGYFFVVAKTALLNAEEANRYELPVYGFCMLLLLAALYYLLKALSKVLTAGENKKTWLPEKMGIIVAGMGCVILGFQLYALSQGRVQFLYEQDKENVAFAAENKEKAVVFGYNPINEWMIWDESEELMQYEKIYFVNLRNEAPVEDEILQQAEKIYVYISRMDEGQLLMEELLEKNPKLSTKKKVRELLYCDLYVLE